MLSEKKVDILFTLCEKQLKHKFHLRMNFCLIYFYYDTSFFKKKPKFIWERGGILEPGILET